jgi:two-component system, chemotaxis family, sensor histidine kinase and response regulator PixL
VFSIQSNLLAIPVDSLLSIVSVNPDQIQTIQDQQYYRWQDQLVPLHAPQHFLRHYPLPQQVHPLAQQASRRRSGMISLLLIAGDAEIIALPVEHILHEQELVIKPFGPAMISPSYLYGCTILGDGSLVPVIDGQALLEEQQSAAADLAPQPEAQSPAEPLTPEPSAPPEAPTAESTPAEVAPRAAAVTPPSTAKRGFKQPMVLVVDDSLTARHSLAATLKKAGYHVLEARDGQEALQQLQQNSTVRAVFCDVEMPRMNGFEFLTSCRQHYSASDLPVIMLTSRGGEKHRKIAKVLGATGYLTKPYLEQEVLKTLKTLIDH